MDIVVPGVGRKAEGEEEGSASVAPHSAPRRCAVLCFHTPAYSGCPLQI